MNDEEERASIVSLGFLSPAIDGMIPTIRDMHAGWFDLAGKLSELGQTQLQSAGKVTEGLAADDPKTVVVRCFIRALSNFQGVFLLAERGMTIEARTLARGCYETAIWLGAFMEKPDEAMAAMEAAQNHSELSGREAAISAFSGHEAMDPDFIAKLEKDVAALRAKQRPKQTNMSDLAKMAGLAEFYPLFKRLSADAAHPSITSLGRHVTPTQADGSVQFILGPDAEGVPEVLGLACNALLSALSFVAQLVGPSGHDKTLAHLATRPASLRAG